MNTYAALPTDSSMNPLHPEGAEFYDADQVAYVLSNENDARTRPTRVFTSFGSVEAKLGEEIQLEHDQTGRFLGVYRIDGIHTFATGKIEGNVPDMLIKHCVAK